MKEPGIAEGAFLLSLNKWDTKALVELLMGHCSLKHRMEKGVLVSAANVKRKRRGP